MADNRLQYIFDLIQGKNTVTPALSKMKDSAISTTKTIAKVGAVAFAGLGTAIGVAVSAASKFEDIGVQFEVLTGNVDTAQSALNQLKDFAAGTPFQFEGIAQAGKQLLGFGFEVENLQPLLTNLGDVAAASGKPIEEMSLIFGQVAAAGKLTGERLLQFQERAIPIGPALAKTLGVAESSIKDLVSKGKVDFATFQEAFQSLSKEGGFAFGGLDKLSGTLSGKISTLKDNFTALAANVGDRFSPIFKVIVDRFTDLFRKLNNSPQFFKVLSDSIASVIEYFPIVVSGIDNAIKGFKILGQVVKIIGSSIGAALVAPFAALENAVNAMIDKVPLLGDKIGKVSLGLDDMFEASKDGAKNAVDEIDSILSDQTFLGKLAINVEKASKPIAKVLREDISLGAEQGAKKGAAAIKKEMPSKKNPVVIPLEFDKKKFEGAAKDPLSFLFGKGKLDLSEKLGVGSALSQSLVSGAEGARDLIVGGLSKGIDALLPGVGSALKPLLDAFSRGPEFVKTMVSSFIKQIPTVFSNIVKSVPTFIEAVLDGVPVLVDSIISSIPDIITEFVNKLPIILNKFVTFIPVAINRIIANLPTLVRAIVASLPQIVSSLASQMPMVIQTLVSSMPLVGSSLAAQMPSVALEMAKSMPSVATGFVSSIANKVPSALSGVFGDLGKSIFTKFKDLISKFNPVNLMTKLFKLPGGAPGPVEKFIGLNFPVVRFAKGGLVRGPANSPADSASNDVIPALLSAGEVVLPKTVVKGGTKSIFEFLKNLNGVSSNIGTPQAAGVVSFANSNGFEVKKLGLGDFISNTLGGIGDAISSVASGALDFASSAGEAFLSGDPGAFAQSVQEAVASFSNAVIPRELREIIESLRLLGANINIPKFIANPLKEAKSAVLSVVDSFKPAFKKLIVPAQLADGGTIPRGYPNDSFPAMLSSNETVISDRITNKLDSFLNGQNSNGQVEALLNKVIALLQTPMKVETSVEINKREFAKILVDLSRTNTRVAF